MARAETIVQLTDEIRARLDTEAARRGVSRSALIREAVEAHLDASTEAAITRAIVEGYTRIPQETPDEWGDLSAQVDAHARELARGLDAEERKAGLPPW